MRRIELYTYEDAARDVEEGSSESETVVKKWKSIVNALREIEGVAFQITPYCEKHMEFGCEGCPLTEFDFECSNPISTYSIFCVELRKLIMIAERMLSLLLAVQQKEEDDRASFV